MVNGKQLTVLWHVDDLKISHVDSTVVDHILDELDLEFGKEAEVLTQRQESTAFGLLVRRKIFPLRATY